MSHNPLFSVVLPTYNRASHLSYTIKTILNQDLKDFELLILDDASTDTTEAVVRSFKDKRIVYIKNQENIRVAANVKKGFLRAKGEYIFTMGDDDLILYVNTFSTIYKEMKKRDAGVGQIGLMYFESDFRRPSSFDHVTDKLLYLPPSKNILLNTVDWHFGFISGNIFRRDLVKADDLLDDDIWWIYFNVVYRSMLKAGAIYFGNLFIAAKISSQGNISYIDLKKNKKFHLEKLFEIYQKFDHSQDRFAKFKKNRLDTVVATLPGIKFYTSNINILLFAQAIIKHHRSYITNLYFWRQILISLILPKKILRIIRKMRIRIGEIKLQKLSKKLRLEKNLMYLYKN